MNLDRVQGIVNAVLYEGYILYPYRPSAVKNRQRWTFGGLYPQAWCGVQEGSEASRMQTQCLLRGGVDAALEVRVRFLHVVAREVGELLERLDVLPAQGEPRFRKVESLEVDGQRCYAWQEAIEREVVVPIARVDELTAKPRRIAFAFEGARELEPLRAGGRIQAVLIRTRMSIAGEIMLAAERVGADVFQATVAIVNTTPFEPEGEAGRDEAQLRALASTHTILGVQGGEFISLLDPPERLRDSAATCENVGTYPVLVGTEGERDTMLSSPIILYDYPEIAPESPGDLFDGTEIDEILSLRILAMTDDEKREMAATDPRAAKLLERTQALTAEQLGKLHGALRSLRPVVGDATADPFDAWDAKPQLAFLRVGGRELKVGDKVRLRPQGGADIMDLALVGKVATIEAIERDFEDQVHVAVAVDDDPGRDFGLQRMPGHRFFFSPDELEALGGPEEVSFRSAARNPCVD
jgi:hypothetical protein